jgi:hypothetical protein
LDLSLPGQFDIDAFWELSDPRGNSMGYQLVEIARKGAFEFNPCPICVSGEFGSFLFTSYIDGEIQQRENQANR